MTLLLIKKGGALALMTVNLILLVRALLAYRHKRAVDEGFLQILFVSPLVAALQLGLGLFFVAEGRQADPMHILYGVLVTAGATAQFALRGNTALAHRYRGKPLVYAFLSLFVMLLSARSWMSG